MVNTLWRWHNTTPAEESPQARSQSLKRRPQPWKRLSAAALLLSLVAGVSVSHRTAAQMPASAPDNQFADLPRLNGEATVELIVNGESIILDIRGNEAPITAGNFIDLVDQGFYDGISFHRVVRDPAPFVAQAGDPQSLDPDFPTDLLGTGGYIDPATGLERTIPLEILPRDAEIPLYNTTFQMAGLRSRPILSHKAGALAMARAQPVDSASSQFYITLDAQAFLDGNYAVFGFVSDGMDVVDEIEQGDLIESASVIAGIENLVRPSTEATDTDEAEAEVLDVDPAESTDSPAD